MPQNVIPMPLTLRLLRLLPPKLRLSIVSRFRNQLVKRSERWGSDVFAKAPLALAPGAFMELSRTCSIHQDIAFAGCFEFDLSERIVDLARKAGPGGTLVDVGANYGYFTMLWAAQQPGNRAIAFEASPPNHAPLRRNVELNGYSQRVQVHPVAAGRAPGHLPFDMGGWGQTGWGGLCSSGAGFAETTVPVDRLDSVLPPDFEADVLKIDVEGADAWVLEGASEILKNKRIKTIFFEENAVRMELLGIPLGTSKSLLEGFGYRCVSIDRTKSAECAGEFMAWV